MPQFTCFARLPFEIRIKIWGLVLRQHTHCAHVFTIEKRDVAGTPDALCGICEAESASTSDVGVYNACVESREAFQKRYAQLGRQSETYQSFVGDLYFFDYRTQALPDTFITVRPNCDLVILQARPGKPWPLYISSLVMNYTAKFSQVTNIGLMYDASWLAGLEDSTYTSLYHEETPRGCFVRIAGHIFLRDTVLWLIDQTMVLDNTPTSELTAGLKIFHNGPNRFCEVLRNKEPIPNSASAFLNTLQHQLTLGTLLNLQDFHNRQLKVLTQK